MKVEREAAALKEAFLRRDEGQSYGNIAAWLNTQGFQTRKGHVFTAHAVKDILNNHFYCGHVKYKDKEFSGKHEVIVSEELFQQVQARRYRVEAVRSVHGPKGLLQGMVACVACGNRLQSDRHHQRVPLYRERHVHECATNNTSIMAGVIDNQIATIIHCLELDSDWKKKMAELAVTNYDGPSPTILQEKRRRLGRAYVDETLSEKEYNWRLAEIDHQLQQACCVINPPIEKAAELFSDISMLWSEATLEEKRRLVNTLIEMVYVDIKTKQVAALKPTPVFGALLGKAIKMTSDKPIFLTPFKKGSVGDGGDGGESNSP